MTASPTSVFRTTIEQFNCPQCEEHPVIPSTHVESRLDQKPGVRPISRTVRVICPACNNAWKQRYALRGGEWSQDGSVDPLTGTELKAFKGRISRLLGERQLAHSA